MAKVINNIDLLNNLRMTTNTTFSERLPVVTQDNIAQVLETMDKYPEMYHEMTGEIIQKIGKQIVADFDEFINPLEIFKKGDMPFGKTIEEIWMDLYPAQEYDQETSETEVLKRELPNIKTKYHVETRENFYKATLSIKELRQAFFSENGIYDYVYSLFTKRLFQSDVLDEYLIMKEIIDMGIEEGLTAESNVQVVDLPYSDDERFSKALAKVLRSTASQLNFYNTSTIEGVKNVTSKANQIIITTPEVEAMLDVDVLSQAFHMEKADNNGRLCIIDGFENEDVLAVVTSDDFLLQYDTYNNLEPEIHNSQGLYRNFYYHHHGVYSFSKFENLVIITKSNEPVEEDEPVE